MSGNKGTDEKKCADCGKVIGKRDISFTNPFNSKEYCYRCANKPVGSGGKLSC